jgi:hypothetical protein
MPTPWSCPCPLIALLPLLAFSAHVQQALFLGHAAPHPVLLAGRQCVLKALAAHPALGADLLGPGYLVPGGPAHGDREEQLRVRLKAGCGLPPVEPLPRWRRTLAWYLGKDHKRTPESLLTYLHW